MDDGLLVIARIETSPIQCPRVYATSLWVGASMLLRFCDVHFGFLSNVRLFKVGRALLRNQAHCVEIPGSGRYAFVITKPGLSNHVPLTLGVQSRTGPEGT